MDEEVKSSEAASPTSFCKSSKVGLPLTKLEHCCLGASEGSKAGKVSLAIIVMRSYSRAIDKLHIPLPTALCQLSEVCTQAPALRVIAEPLLCGFGVPLTEPRFPCDLCPSGVGRGCQSSWSVFFLSNPNPQRACDLNAPALSAFCGRCFPVGPGHRLWRQKRPG